MIKFGITLGDPAGIGPEILAKSLPLLEQKKAFFIVFGDEAYILELAKKFKHKLPKNLEIINLSSLKIIPGQPHEDTHRATLSYLTTSIKFLKEGEIQGIITLPINKESFKVLSLPYRGHTEFLAEAFEVKKYAMTFFAKKLKIALATTHIPLKDVPYKIDPKYIETLVDLIYSFLNKYNARKETFKIALCALNPHAGESGILGEEEQSILIPLITRLQKRGIPIFGPYPADSLFYRAINGEFHFVIALYHDQGLIPFKLLYWREGVNLTLGLPFVRTSPIHGTAYDIAGKGIADPSSFLSAVNLALKLVKKW